MSSLFGIEASRAAQYAIAFAIILVLVALFGLVLRKLTGARLIMPGSDRGRSRQPRLGIVDVYDLDRQRQLILLRRDNVEHLLLIGGLNDVVIETNIVRVAGARLPQAANESGAERMEPVLDQAPPQVSPQVPSRAPQVESAGRPSIETQLAAQLGAFVRRPAESSDADQELAPVASVSAPMPARAEPVLKPDAVTLTPPPAVQGLRAEARTPDFPAPSTAPAVAPTPVADRPAPRPIFPQPFQSRPTPVPPTPPAPPPAQPEAPRAPQPAPVERAAPAEVPAPAEQPAAERSGPDAALLSDMAKQLEEALKRPAAPIPPPEPLQAQPTPRVVVSEADADDEDLLEPTTASEEVQVERSAAPVEEERRSEPLPLLRPAAEPPRPAPAPLQPLTPPRPANTSEAPTPGPQDKPKDDKASDPFSVEEIEAEFARLLGRPLDTNKKG